LVAVNTPLQFLTKIPVPWVFILAYLIGAVLERLWPTRLVDRVPAITGIGWVLFGSGAVIAGWGLATFYRARTTTVPGETSNELVMWGPYQFTRNPMYVGLTLAYLGEVGLLRQTWPLVMLPLVLAYMNWTLIPVEEAKLMEVFGKKYVNYQQRVRRWL
jgi:protein-S-isoprenylcysteine O-methyltransferase Ste14